jgi:hypothetical protein
MATSPFNIVGRSSYGLSAIPNVGQQAGEQITPIPVVSAATNPYKGGSGGGLSGIGSGVNKWFQGFVDANGGSSELPWWQDALNRLSSAGSLVTQQTANWTDGKFNWQEDIPLVLQGKMLYDAGKKAYDNSEWLQNPWNALATPAYVAALVNGTAANIGKDAAPFQQTLRNTGVKNNEALFWGGLAGDIALDPSTYLTFGGSSAIKAGASAGKSAARSAVAEAAETLGKEYSAGLRRVPTADVANEIADRFYRKALDTYSGAGNALRADVVRDTAKQYYQSVIDNAGKSARSSAQNAIVNFDVPFTNITFQFGKRPAALTKTSPEIKTAGKTALTNQLNAVGLTGDAGKKFVEKALGKDDFAKVTFQEYQYLKGEIARYGKQFENGALNPFTTRSLNDYESAMANALRAGASVGDIEQLGKQAVANGTDVDFAKVMDSVQGISLNSFAPDSVSKFNPTKFVPEMGGTSRLTERVLDATNALNPRRAGDRMSGGLVNNVGNQIQNTFGQLRNTSRDLDQVAKALKPIQDLNQAESRLVEYTLEGASDEGLKRVAQMGMPVDIDKVSNAVNALRNGMADTPVESYRQIAQAEQAVGGLDSTRANYAPHVLANQELGADIIAKYQNDPDLQQLFTVSPGNKFNQRRSGFQSFEQLDKFVDGLRSRAATETDPKIASDLKLKADELSALFERNPIKAYKKRLYASYRTRTLGNLYQELKSDSLIVTPDQAKSLGEAAEDYVRLDPKESGKLGLPAGSLMHKDVKKGLLEADKLFNNEGLNKFLDNYSSINNMWKSITTSYRPVHHINNLIGNVFNNSLAGVGLQDYRRATQTLNRMFRGKPKQEDLDLMREVADRAVLGQAHSEEYRRLFGDQRSASKLRKAETFVTDNRYVSFLRRYLGDSTDNWSRLAHYIHVKRATGSADLAAQSVRKYLFAYGENTSADRAIRLVIPFWTWTKHNIPLQLEQIMKQPRYYQTWLRLQDASYESAGEDRSKQPEFIRNDYLRTPWGTYRNPRAPMSDLNNVGDPLKWLVSGATPALKVPFELATNTNTFTGKPIDYSLERGGPRDPQSTLEYGLGQAPILNDIYKLATGNSSPLDVLFGKELQPK